MTPSKSVYQRLQEWYQGQCDGDWEHNNGVKIESLDNPGWMLTVDLGDTEWVDLKADLHRVVRSENDWCQYLISKWQFKGAGGPLNIEEVIESFLNLVTPPQPKINVVL